MAARTSRFGWLAAMMASGALLAGMGPAAADVAFVQASGALSDLAPATANATDGASADLFAVEAEGSTTFVFLVTNLAGGQVGTTYGAHIHTGTCVPGNGAAAGPHYNTGGTPSTDTEVWLDFEVLPGGYGYGIATVPFVIRPGTAHAAVIHAQPTQNGGATPGAAGARMACLPVEF